MKKLSLMIAALSMMTASVFAAEKMVVAPVVKAEVAPVAKAEVAPAVVENKMVITKNKSHHNKKVKQVAPSIAEAPVSK